MGELRPNLKLQNENFLRILENSQSNLTNLPNFVFNGDYCVFERYINYRRTSLGSWKQNGISFLISPYTRKWYRKNTHSFKSEGVTFKLWEYISLDQLTIDGIPHRDIAQFSGPVLHYYHWNSSDIQVLPIVDSDEIIPSVVLPEPISTFDFDPSSDTTPNEDIVENTTFITIDDSIIVNGSVQAREFLHLSDLRLKRDVKDLKNALNTLKKLNGKQYRWKVNEINNSFCRGDSGEEILGLIAQEVLRVCPAMVHKIGDYYAVDYAQLHALVIEGIKELSVNMDKMEKEIVDIKSSQIELENQFQRLSMSSPKTPSNSSDSSISSLLDLEEHILQQRIISILDTEENPIDARELSKLLCEKSGFIVKEIRNIDLRLLKSKVNSVLFKMYNRGLLSQHSPSDSRKKSPGWKNK